MLPEYQSNDIENCLALSPICQIRFSNLPVIPSRRNSIFSAESPIRKPAKRSKNTNQDFQIFLPFVLLLSNNDSWMCLLFAQGDRLFNPPKGKHVLKRAENHRCEATTLGKGA